MFLIILVFVCVVCSSNCSNEPYCKLKCDFGFAQYNHTVCNRKEVKCGAAPECGADFQEVVMTSEIKAAILDLHNDFRQKVASGKESRYQKQPPASNMLQMIYNEELQNISRCWANACKGNPLIHDQCRRTEIDEHVGQNLGFYNDSRSDFDIMNITLQLIEYWFDEVLLFNKHWVADTKDRSADVVVGHYTQLVWADSLELGCAITRYTTPNLYSAEEYKPKWNHLLLACNYGPGGNYLGQPVYRVGRPCSHCPPHTRCGYSNRTDALCVLNDVADEYDYDGNEDDEKRLLIDQKTQPNNSKMTVDKDLIQKFIELFKF